MSSDCGVFSMHNHRLSFLTDLYPSSLSLRGFYKKGNVCRGRQKDKYTTRLEQKCHKQRGRERMNKTKDEERLLGG